jgi:hypothetical protein
VIRRAPAALLLAAALAATLAGCSFAPDPAVVRADASAVFDDLVGTLSATDPAVLRTVEVLPEEARPCAEEGRTQASLVARGTLSVTADPAGAAGILDTVAGSLDTATWKPVEAGSGDAGERAWASADGIVVTLTDASPVVVVAVFPPCAPA